ncbi:cytochrome P450 [Phanerochaete sordida]|uniref:Cytochrome P450 n=1 Tax=Phanerochaete sordida TaxID=48140 RepID=A0A9P3LMM9_9APHY|nr:cytochrome P450 [Phanerochaete sordida]
MSQANSSEAITSGSRWLVYFTCSLPFLFFVYSWFSPASLRHIPTVGGSSLPLLSYRGAWDFQANGKDSLQRGYDKYKGRVFKIPFMDRWVAVITGKELVDEMQRLPDEIVSFSEAFGEVTGFKYIFPDLATRRNPFHMNMIQRQLTKHMSVAFGEMYEEMDMVFKELLPGDEKEWVPVHAIDAARKVIARASNRVFVGLPLCRDPAFLRFIVDFTIDASKARDVQAYFPPILKPFVAKMVVDLDARMQEGMRIFCPLIEERMELAKQFGKDSPSRPDDMFQWILNALVESGEPMEQVVLVTMFVNIAAISTSSNSFTHALYHLAARPEWIAPLRQEAEAAILAEGWTKNAMNRLAKTDSFLRESQRHNSIVPLTCKRKALQPFTLSDGTHIPRGTICVTPAFPTHFDADNYADAAAFGPWRYVPADAGSDAKGAPQKHFVTTSAEYVPFGHGKHACPGRFFAATELKAMMAYVVLNYDVKFADDGVRPENVVSALTVAPHPGARVLFRKRNSILSYAHALSA